MAVKTTKTAAPAKKPAAAAPAAKGAAKAAPPKSAATAPKAAAPVTVTLKNLSASLAERHGMAKKQADGVLSDVFEMLVGHLKAGERVRIGGLGILEVKNRPARMGRNPATGAAIEIKASKKVAFRPAKELKEAI